jgi:hypothetical protein
MYSVFLKSFSRWIFLIFWLNVNCYNKHWVAWWVNFFLDLDATVSFFSSTPMNCIDEFAEDGTQLICSHETNAHTQNTSEGQRADKFTSDNAKGLCDPLFEMKRITDHSHNIITHSTYIDYFLSKKQFKLRCFDVFHNNLYSHLMIVSWVPGPWASSYSFQSSFWQIVHNGFSHWNMPQITPNTITSLTVLSLTNIKLKGIVRPFNSMDTFAPCIFLAYRWATLSHH